MTEVELLLTQEYADYNAKISAAFVEKEELEADFKTKFAEYKQAKAQIEEQVAEVHSQWEEWKSEKLDSESE